MAALRACRLHFRPAAIAGISIPSCAKSSSDEAPRAPLPICTVPRKRPLLLPVFTRPEKRRRLQDVLRPLATYCTNVDRVALNSGYHLRRRDALLAPRLPRPACFFFGISSSAFRTETPGCFNSGSSAGVFLLRERPAVFFVFSVFLRESKILTSFGLNF